MAFPHVLPASRVPDPAEAPTLRWGILAPGWIARKFALAAHIHTRQRLVAVGSRSQARAEDFAARFGIERAVGDYAALVADPQVDAVYVAAPHSEHAELALAAIAAGKHVLVEKAFTRNATEARAVADAARSAGVTVMEAMWTRFLPRMDIVRQLLADGTLGEVEFVVADHGQPISDVPRLHDPKLAGGGLLDLGIYPISFACFALGLPKSVVSTGVLAETGVDRQIAATLGDFADRPGAHAQVNCTMVAKTPTTAVISGTEARVELAGDFYAPGPVRVVTPDAQELVVDPDLEIRDHYGMAYEVAHFAQLVADGRTDSPLMPIDETVAIMEILDRIREAVGVTYPGE